MNEILNKRRAGILLHITSLPGAGPQGVLGRDAYDFINFLHSANMTVWQTLPLNITHADGSPYQCLSAHAGNPAFISTEGLIERGWLRLPEDCPQDFQEHAEEAANPGHSIQQISSVSHDGRMTKAYNGFLEFAGQQDKDDFFHFCQEKAFWLDDFALFMVLREQFNHQCWNQWPEPYKERDAKAIKEARHQLRNEIDTIKFQQYIFFRQWMDLKAYANQHDVLLFGDIPIFVSYDSADVWANREVFKLDEAGEMLVVAGVPPDYFSETGQRWGNPHYNWRYLKRTGFSWWVERMQTQLELFDILRIDHFRGLEAAWEIPAEEKTAQYGQWVKAPGKALLEAIQAELGSIPLVAEDLGIITHEVDELRNEFNLPGMKILQFAFGSGPDNPYLPNNYEKNCVVYTGTHDNDTTAGWVEKLSEDEKRYIDEYLGHPATSLSWALMLAALASVANLAIIPMQDILELGSEHRMNTPGTTTGNWKWRFQWDQLPPDRAATLAHLVNLFNRN